MSKIQEALDKIRAGAVQSGSAQRVSSSEASSGTHAIKINGQTKTLKATSVPSVTDMAVGSSVVHEKLRPRQELSELRLIHTQMRDIQALDSFRELRTAILRRLEGRPSKILVTSLAVRGGASFVATNLGAAIALDEAMTALVVDCNLRAPALTGIALDSGPDLRGLRDYLRDLDISVGEIIHATGIERLRVIPAGRSENLSGEYFTSERVRSLFDQLKSRYPNRHLILDTPPLSESADTRILLELCDYVVLVVPYGRATHNGISRALAMIESNIPVGIVFNNEPRLLTVSP